MPCRYSVSVNTVVTYDLYQVNRLGFIGSIPVHLQEKPMSEVQLLSE